MIIAARIISLVRLQSYVAMQAIKECVKRSKEEKNYGSYVYICECLLFFTSIVLKFPNAVVTTCRFGLFES